jgi:hypothetical protein
VYFCINFNSPSFSETIDDESIVREINILCLGNPDQLRYEDGWVTVKNNKIKITEGENYKVIVKSVRVNHQKLGGLAVVRGLVILNKSINNNSIGYCQFVTHGFNESSLNYVQKWIGVNYYKNDSFQNGSYIKTYIFKYSNGEHIKVENNTIENLFINKDYYAIGVNVDKAQGLLGVAVFGYNIPALKAVKTH